MRKKAGILFLFKCIKIPLSIFLLSLTAKYFGVSIGREVWLLAFSTMMVIDTAFWGPINEIFRSKFIFLREKEGEKQALKYTQSLLFYIFLFSSMAMAFIILLPQFNASIIAPKYNNKAFELLTSMLVYAAPILLFNQAVLIGNSILNAYEIFYVPEISGAINIIINIFFLIILTPVFGAYALLIAYFISVLINMIFIIFYIIKNKIPLFNFNWNIDFKGFKIYFIYSFPLLFSYFFGQISIIIEKMLATTLGIGAVSILDYANKIPTMMYAVVINIIFTILMPVLAKNYSNNNSKEYVKSFQEIYQMGFLLLAFVIVFIIGASNSLFSILYQSNKISVTELYKIILLSKFYSFTLFGVFQYTIFSISIMTSSKIKKYALITIIIQVMVITLNVLLLKSLNIFVFPIVFTVAHVFGAFLMYKQFPYINNQILNITTKYTIYILISCVIMIFIKNLIFFKNNYINIVLLTISQIIIMVFVMYIMKIEELKLFLTKIKYVITKK